jgi:hypothetical protein
MKIIFFPHLDIVKIDGVDHTSDLSALMFKGILALAWDSAVSQGYVSYKNTEPTLITEFTEYQSIVDKCLGLNQTPTTGHASSLLPDTTKPLQVIGGMSRKVEISALFK